MKFPLTRSTQVATAGSCFAQHIARNLRQRGFTVVDTEPPPRRMPEETARDYGYRLYSARYGNIYTVRQLLQLVRDATGKEPSPAEAWERNGRYYDARRPSVEPGGLETPEEVQLHRDAHLKAVRRMLKTCSVFVFTLGLTEAWTDRETGVVYPTAPGTLAGSYDPARHAFVNFTFKQVHDDFVAVRKLIKRVNPDVRFLLTVSPVPLTATASEEHVLTATIYSKSVLRAVAGQLATEFDDIDYFPSYEIVATPFLGKVFYDDSLRSVSDEGVATVMRVFFDAVERQETEPAAQAAPARDAGRPRAADDDVVCEDILLEAFAP